MLQDARRERRRPPAAIGFADDRAQREAAHPVPAPLVAEQIPPAARPHRFPSCVASVDDRARPRDDHDARGIAHAGLERDEGVVDDEHFRLVTDAGHDAADDREVGFTVDTGHPETDCGRHDAALAERVLHHLMEHLLDLQLAGGLQVRAAAARFGEHAGLLVGELTDCFRAAGIDAEDVQHGQGLDPSQV